MLASSTSSGAWAALSVGIGIFTAVCGLIWRSGRWSARIELAIQRQHDCTDRRLAEMDAKVGGVDAKISRHIEETAEHHRWVGPH